MAASFTNSLRSLEAESPRPIALGTLVVIGLFALWLAWFAWGRITLYATSTTATVESVRSHRPARLRATFPPTLFGQLRPGQMAAFTPQGALPAAQPFPCVIAQIENELTDGQVVVIFTLAPETAWPQALAAGLPGVVTLPLEEVSPAELLFRTVGQQLALSPTPTPASGAQP